LRVHDVLRPCLVLEFWWGLVGIIP
jgi:hypothetical protein